MLSWFYKQTHMFKLSYLIHKSKNNNREENINMAFIFRGKLYENLANLAEEHNISLLTFSNRVYAGWTMGEVVDIYAVTKNEKIMYKGKVFKSYKELGDYFNLDYDLMVDRLRKKWSISDIVEKRRATSRHKLLSDPINREIVEVPDTIQVFELYALLHCPGLYKAIVEIVKERRTASESKLLSNDINQDIVESPEAIELLCQAYASVYLLDLYKIVIRYSCLG